MFDNNGLQKLRELDQRNKIGLLYFVCNCMYGNMVSNF